MFSEIDVHSKGKYRDIGSVSSNEYFAKTFQLSKEFLYESRKEMFNMVNYII